MNSRIRASYFWYLGAAALLGILTWVLCQRLNHPWTYNDDYNGAFWSQAARNLAHAGFFSTAGVPAPLYFGPPPIPSDYLYVHHPALLADMMYLDRALLGESEAAARALPIVFSVLTAGLLFLFAAAHAGPRAALFVLALFAAAPMELHYGQMVNFEAPELFFILSALCAFHYWRRARDTAPALLFLFCCGLTLWTDWQGYLLVGLLTLQLLAERKIKMASALIVLTLLSGCAFMIQIRLADAGAWQELFRALHERTSHADVNGVSFTLRGWMSTEAGYLTTLYHPVALCLAGLGAGYFVVRRNVLPASERPLLHVAGIIFIVDAIYVCVLRNQSYIHDFASFYFLVPVAVFTGLLLDHVIRLRPHSAPYRCIMTAAALVLAAALLFTGVRKLDNIDTQFCILGDDDTEPATLMPDVGRVISQSFPVDCVVICNFDKYYSPLPYYARHVMTNDCETYAEWTDAVQESGALRSGGIIWNDGPGAAELLSHLPKGETTSVAVDGISFTLWQPHRPS